MSIATEIARIQSDRNTIRTKLVDLGLVEITADLDDCATAVEGIENRGSVSATVQEGDTYTIPKGYHNGSGTVSGVAGGGNYSLQSKTITPTKTQQNVTPDSGYYGLSDVTVAAIPTNYQDVTPVTAAAGDILANKIIVDANGKTVAGAMPNNGAVSKTLDTATTSYTVPAGYHDGMGTVKVVNESKSVTPSKSVQTVTPSSGKVLSEVTVNAIPDVYQDISNVTAEAINVQPGYIFVDASGVEITGAMPSYEGGRINKTLWANEKVYIIPAGYHDGTGQVKIDSIDETSVVASPTKEAQIFQAPPEQVFTGFTVEAIPDTYQDVTGVTATADKVLTGSTFVDAEGNQVGGTMPNIGAAGAILSAATTKYTIPEGYHNGEGTVSITLEAKSVTPTKSEQSVLASSGKVLSAVYVGAIPDEYQDVTGVTATAANVLGGKYIVLANGTKVEGSMADNGSVSTTIDGLTQTSVMIPVGYTSGGTVSLTDDIETQLAAI